MTALLAGFGLAWDYTGESVLTISSGSWGLIGLIAAGVFVLLTVAREIELYLHPRPKVEYDGLSPDKNLVTISQPTGSQQVWGYFFRIAFKNKAKNPSGADSTAQATTASITVFDGETSLDSWTGRWPANYEPRTYAEKVIADRLDILANNQQAILDIGMRYEGQSGFQLWDNGRYFLSPARQLIPPGCYVLEVTLFPANCSKKTWRFSLCIPNEPQSNDLRQVKIRRIRRREMHKEGSQT